MTKDELYAHPGWRWCTAESAREDVLLQGIRSTLAEKLEWLEEAETLTLQLRSSREQAYRGEAPDNRGLPAGEGGPIS